MCGDLRPLANKDVQMLDHFFPLLFPKDSESLKILDIRLREVGAKRPLNGTSKRGQTYGHIDLLAITSEGQQRKLQQQL